MTRAAKPALMFALLLACRGTHRISIEVPPEFTGAVDIGFCSASGEQGRVVIDAHGQGSSAECPKGDVDLSVQRAGKRVDNAKVVALDRTGDGILMRARLSVPPSSE